MINNSANTIIDPVRQHLCRRDGDNSPSATCPCAALEEALKKIVWLEGENAALREALQEFARVKAQNAEYRHMLFGRASEKMTVLGKPDDAELSAVDTPTNEISNSSAEKPAGNPEAQEEHTETEVPLDKSRRGAKPGHKGHGRCIPQNLPTVEVFLPVPEDQAKCKTCGKPGKPVPFIEESVQIDVRIEPVKVVYIRQKVKFDCGCDGQTRFVTAPEPPQAVNKSKLSHQFLAWIIYLKYILAVCLSIMQTAKLHGLKPVAYLNYYLDECARAGGAPAELDSYLPWNIPPEVRDRYQMGGKEQDLCA